MAAFALLIIIVMVDGATLYLNLVTINYINIIKIVCSLLGSLLGYGFVKSEIEKGVKT